MFTVENLKTALQLFKDKIDKNKDYLSELDTPIGDGDHGNNMSRGMEAVSESLQGKAPETIQDVFKLTAMALISKVGGASGPLYGTAMMEMAKASATTSEALPILEAGLAGIEKRGNSQPGEKTMLDLWAPAIEAVRSGNVTLEDLQSAVDKTKDIVATKGRASYVGERSVGHIDPGAMSSLYFFESLMEAGVFND
ncbi:dihydroxyacetone kinase subunit L [Enterococcus sp. DIV0242_7C1]|uniref:phosphoenolpyruvate--glycerone phosphotransferase n=1 Tax=Candidatus Enterococcus dunnyi TaxID=1834192 RepID=A0A200IZ83_9ENTE|nr:MULTISPECIES: dihydroxyacetone kinase subunit DhaL [unclassified Enterococcus]MBO0470348.1 dihydroxyacetone kinase subunit L [Enterococcus sp. DIV0242_7C1]MCA5014244.1 dihydroxyacetone kinase subunit L [Enterococcus sp. S23]MCA5017534.1 dihydroxyacetone kinase subunit L [Enterococcus sp. S22(2020)]OUZ30283.1 dihydroxyacetone kinase, L subunit [Enterococcus sp. 9D6_DIV0238]